LPLTSQIEDANAASETLHATTLDREALIRYSPIGHLPVGRVPRKPKTKKAIGAWKNIKAGANLTPMQAAARRMNELDRLALLSEEAFVLFQSIQLPENVVKRDTLIRDTGGDEDPFEDLESDPEDHEVTMDQWLRFVRLKITTTLGSLWLRSVLAAIRELTLHRLGEGIFTGMCEKAGVSPLAGVRVEVLERMLGASPPPPPPPRGHPPPRPPPTPPATHETRGLFWGSPGH